MPLFLFLLSLIVTPTEARQLRNDYDNLVLILEDAQEVSEALPLLEKSLDKEKVVFLQIPFHNAAFWQSVSQFQSLGFRPYHLHADYVEWVHDLKKPIPNLPNSISCCRGVVFQGDKVLLIQDRYRPQYWGFPGGCIDPGELETEAVLREVKEEVGLDLSHFELFYTHSFSPSARGFTEHEFNFYAHYEGDLEAVKIQDEEILQARWVSIPELLEKEELEGIALRPHEKNLIQQAYQHLQGKARSPNLQAPYSRSVTSTY